MSFRELLDRAARSFSGTGTSKIPERPISRFVKRGSAILFLWRAAALTTDLDLTIDRKYRYTAGRREWFEVSAMTAGKRVSLEVEEADQVTVFLYADGRSFTLDELELAEEDLAILDDRQNPADNFPFASRTWMFRQSREMSRFDDEHGLAEGFFG